MNPVVAARRIASVLLGGGMLAMALALVGAPRPLPVDAPLPAHVAGMLAGYQAAVMLILILVSCAPVLERLVGPDRLARWHSRCGRLFIVMVAIHGAAAVQAWATVRGLTCSPPGSRS